MKLCTVTCWHQRLLGPSWPWSHDSWIYNNLCNRCLSPLMLWVRLPLRTRCTTLCDKVCQWPAAGRWFPPGPPISSTNKTYRHDITGILLKVALNTIKPTNDYLNQKHTDPKSNFTCVSVFNTNWTVYWKGVADRCLDRQLYTGII
jgi:hypothetical protein